MTGGCEWIVVNAGTERPCGAKAVQSLQGERLCQQHVKLWKEIQMPYKGPAKKAATKGKKGKKKAK